MFTESRVDQLDFKAIRMRFPEAIKGVWVRSWNGGHRGTITGDRELILWDSSPQPFFVPRTRAPYENLIADDLRWS